MKGNNLNYWSKVLTEQGYNCQIFEKSPQTPHRYLNVDLDVDPKGRSRVLEMRIDSYSLPSAKDGAELIIHLFSPYPFLVKEEAVGEMARLMMFLNKGLDTPGFGLDESSKLAFFRYGVLTYNGQQSAQLLMAIIGMIRLLMDTFTDQVEAVAGGVTARDALSNLVRNLT